MMIRLLILLLTCVGAFAQTIEQKWLGSAQQLVDFTPGTVGVVSLTNGLGAFRWDATSTATTNTATVFGSTKKTPGRWISFPFGTVEGDASSKIPITGGEANSLTINSGTIAGTITAAGTNLAPADFAYLKDLPARVALLAAQTALDAAVANITANTSAIAANTAAIALKAAQANVTTISNSVTANTASITANTTAIAGKLDASGGTATNLFILESARRALYLNSASKIVTLNDVVMADLYTTPNTTNDLSSDFAAMEATGRTNAVIKFGEGEYWGQRTFTNRNIRLIGAGMDRTIIRAAVTNQHLLLFTVTNHVVEISDMTIDGRGISKSGISSQHGDRLILRHVRVINCGTNGVNGPIDGVAFTSPWGTIEAYDCWFENNQRDGAFCFPAEYATFERCVSTNNGRSGLVCDVGAATTFYEGIGGKWASYYKCRSSGNGAIGFHFESNTNYPYLGMARDCISDSDGGRDSVWGYSYGFTFGSGTYGWMDNCTLTNFQGTATGYGQGVLGYNNSGPVWFTRNKIYKTKSSHGIEWNQLVSTPCYVEGNYIEATAKDGLHIYLAAESSIIGNTITGSTNNGIWMNTSPRARIIGNIIKNSSNGPDATYTNIYSGIQIITSLGFLAEGNHVNGSSQKYAVDWDSSSRNLSTWNNNRISGFATSLASDSGNATEITLRNGVRDYKGPLATTLTSPLSGDTVRNSTVSLSAPSALTYIGTDWVANQPLGNTYSYYGRTNWGGIYNHEYVVDTSNAAIWRRNNGASNEIRITLGTNAVVASGAGFGYLTNGVLLGQFRFSPQGMTIDDPGFLSTAFFDYQNRRVGIKTQTPQATLDVNGDATILLGLSTLEVTVNPLAYDATTWNGSTKVPTRDDIRDKFESLTLGSLQSSTSAQLSTLLSDETGSGAAVFGTSPTIITPTIASLINATHTHQNSAGGGTLDAAAIASGNLSLSRLATIADGTILGNSTGSTAVPAAIGTLPSAVQANITGLGSVTSGTLDASTGLTVKNKNYLMLPFPEMADGTGAVLATDSTQIYNGRPLFSGTAATNANFVEYRIPVPADLDTATDLRATLHVRLNGADTSASIYNIACASVANSASAAGTLANWVKLDVAADASGASGDAESVANVTLTGWRSALTANNLWVIRLNRDGVNDTSNVAHHVMALTIEYTSTQ